MKILARARRRATGGAPASGVRTVASLRPGERVYTVPWMVQQTTDGRRWIQAGTDVLVEDGPRGTADMEVRRTADGVEVRPIAGSMPAMGPWDAPPPGIDWLPVTVFHEVPKPAWRTPGTREYTERQALTSALLTCGDVDRAREMTARMHELRGN